MAERFHYEFAALDRYAYMHIPDGSPPGDGWPLVIALHGGGSTPQSMMHFSQLIPAAQQHRFAVLFPAGTGPNADFLTWNAGRCCGHAARYQVDDVGTLGHLLDLTLDRWPIDGARVFATGISNGGMMAYRLAGEFSHRVAAIAAVAGALVYDPPTLPRGVPVIHFHGTQDDFVPYPGGRGARSLRRVDFPSVSDTLARWRDVCGFSPTDRVEPLFSGPEQLARGEWFPQADRRITATRHIHAEREAQPVIVEIKIDGGGHTWPGVAPPLPFMGPTAMSISANQLMWEFFEQVSRA